MAQPEYSHFWSPLRRLSHRAIRLITAPRGFFTRALFDFPPPSVSHQNFVIRARKPIAFLWPNRSVGWFQFSILQRRKNRADADTGAHAIVTQ
jgi:hypothetical protein